MSRIGNQPIQIPNNVKVELTGNNQLSVKGPKGELMQKIHPTISVNINNNTISLARANNEKHTKALHGLHRALINNMIIGSEKEHTKSLEVKGLGNKASIQDKLLQLQLGKSHITYLVIPPNLNVEVETTKGKKSQTFIHIKGIDKQFVGQIAALIRKQRPTEPYISNRSGEQKGIRYIDEILIGKKKKDAK